MPVQDKIEQLQAQLGYVFTDVTGLKLALTHRSAAGLHNERLEFLGDAVLELVVTHRLYHQFPGVDEGRLSRFRAQLVRKESLASKARELGVGRHLILGPGERQSGGWERDSILADSLEAILGAIYLEAGLQTVTELITDWFEDQFNRLDARRVIKD
ncbi:ribonuclease III, partial [Pseudomonadales bacterium]|nr:ribonuclease III [Pseudomonadales bacterium]